MRRILTILSSGACAVGIFLGVSATTALATSPPPQWASHFATAGASLWSLGVGSFPDGSSVMGFQHWSGNGTINGTTITAATAVAKVSATGAVSWVAQPSDSASTARSIAAGPDGTSVVVGLFSGSTTIGSTTLTSVGSNDVFVAKLGADGTWLWAKSVGGTESDDGRDVAVLPDGSIIVTGNFRSSVSFGSTTLVSQGGQDIFVAKLNAAGDWQWALRGGGAGGDSPNVLAVTASGAAAITGVFSGTIGGSTAPSFGSTTLSSLGSGDIYVATVTSGGAWNWAVAAGSTANDGYDASESVAFAPDGSVFLTGGFGGAMTLGSLPTLTPAGSDDLFVAKLTAAGTWAWSVSAGGAGTDRGSDIAALSDGSAVMLGFYGNTPLTLGATTLTRAGGNTGYDIAVARITAAGSWDWATSIAASGSMSVTPATVTSRANDSLLISGVFSTNAPAQTITLGSTVITSIGTGSDANSLLTCLGSTAADCQALAAVPDAPQSVSASTPADGATATAVSFTAPNANGSPILSYTATCTSSTGGATATQSGAASPLTVTGLTPGATYTCTVTATSAVGTSAASTASAPITVPSTAAGGTSASATAERTSGAAETAAPTTLRLSQAAATADGAVVVFTATAPGRASLVGTVKHGSHGSPTRACATAKRVRRAGPVKLVCTLRSDLRASSAGSKLTLVTTFTPTGGTAVSSKRTITLRGDGAATAPPPTG